MTATPVQQRLEEIIKTTKSKGVIVYPPTLGWSYAHQRPQQILKAAATAGYLCIFCTTQPREDHVVNGLRKINERLYICDGLDGLVDIKDLILYITWPLHEMHKSKFTNPLLWYDCIDDLSLFTQELNSSMQQVMINSERTLTLKAEVVTATAEILLQQKRKVRPDALLVENGTVLSDFDKPLREKDIPEDIQCIRNQGKPILGYYGALADWFDYDMIIEIATRRPDWNIVLIGMDYEGSLARNKSRLAALPNVYLLGRKDYEELYKYSICFDVGLVPFKNNQIIQATNPVKMFEYMAAGVPVVSVDIPEARKYSEVVLTASTIEEYVSQMEKAIPLKQNESYVMQLKEVARRSTWEERFKLVDDAITTVQQNRNFRSKTYDLMNITLRNEQGITALSQTDYSSAERIFEELITEGVRTPWLYFNYAQALMSKGDYSAAANALEQEATINPNHFVYSHLAYMYAELHRFQEAHHCITAARQMQHNQPNPLIEAVYNGIADMSALGDFYKASGRTDEAHQTYLCGLMRSPTNASLLSRLSTAPFEHNIHTSK